MKPFQNLITREFVEKMKINKQIKANIFSRNILPIKHDPLVANLFGHLIGDGGIRISKGHGGRVRFYGSNQKLLSIAKDYEKVFAKQVDLTKKSRPFDTGFKLDVGDSAVARLFAYLGAPSG